MRVPQVFHGLRKCYHISQVEHSLNMLNMFAWFLVGITSDEEVVIYLPYVKPLGKSVKRRNLAVRSTLSRLLVSIIE